MNEKAMSSPAPGERLARVKLALNDWIHCHAPDMCETYRVEETHKRIQDFGGTLYYIAKAVEDVEAVKAHLSETRDTKNADPQSGAAGAGMPVPSIREGDAGVAPGQSPALPHPSASSATREPIAYINYERRCLEWAKPVLWDTPLSIKLERTPLYAAPQSAPPEVGEPVAFSGVTHVLKTDPIVFDAVASGHKQFEIRRNDRGFVVGDKLLLRRTRYTGAEMANGQRLDFTGETIAKIIGYILHGPIYGLADGWAVLGFKNVACMNRERK